MIHSTLNKEAPAQKREGYVLLEDRVAHDLQDTSVKGFPEVLDALVQREVGPPDAEEAEVAKVGVDGIAAEAKEAAEVMDP